MAINLTGRPSAGPNLTGWTSSTLTPRVTASPAPAPRLTGAAGMKQMNEASLARQGGIAPDAEGQILLQEMAAAGAAAGGPSKPKEYHDALYEFIQRNPKVIQSMLNRDIELFARPREGSLARVAEDAKEKTRERQEKALEKQQAKQAKQAIKDAALKDSGAPPNASAAPPLPGAGEPAEGQRLISTLDPNAGRNPADAELARRTAALKPAQDAEAARKAALTPEQLTAERKATFDARTIPRELSGGGSGSSGSSGSSGGGGGGGGGSGSALGPNPRIATTPQTPLEQLLGQMFPDLVGGGADPMADPRNPGAASSTFNNVIANLGLGGGAAAGGGWVPGPAVGGGNGATIAGSIPGAPDWLGAQINALPGGGGGGFFAPPAAPPRLDLAGLAALSGEQERQRATMLKAQSDAAAAWQAQLLADQRRQQQQDQLNRLRLGGAAPSLSSWQSPTFKPSAWTPTLPSY